MNFFDKESQSKKTRKTIFFGGDGGGGWEWGVKWGEGFGSGG